MFRPNRASHTLKRVNAAIKLVLLATLMVGSFSQIETGLADNGDFTRLMLWFTSGPLGFEQSWPQEHTNEYHERFFNYTIQYWKLDFPFRSRWISSILLIWLPGIILNVLFYSHSILYLPFVSIVPRVFCILFLCVLFRWIDINQSSMSGLMYCTFGIPFVLMMVSTDYLAYFTSLYQEPASLVSLLILLALLVLKGRRELTTKELLSLGMAVFLINAAKLSNIYWAVLVLFYVLPFRAVLRDPKVLLRYSAYILVIPLAFSILQANLVSTRKDNAYQSLFCGVLTFSEHAAEHLQDYNIQNGLKCIAVPAYVNPGLQIIKKYPSFMRHSNTLAIILKEPKIAWRMLRYAADSMQIIHLHHLGQRILDNRPSLQQNEHHDAMKLVDTPVYGLWSGIKQHVFPKGIPLIICLAVFMCVFIFFLQKTRDIRTNLAYGGVIVSVSCIVDLWIQLFGDGRQDLIKHLFLSNLLFDIAVIMLLNIAAITVIKKYRIEPPSICSQ